MNMCIPLTGAEFNLYDLLKDLVTLGLGGATVYAAYEGLNTRRNESERNAKYTLAKNILIATYKLRSGFDAVRNPAIWLPEFPELPESFNNKSEKEKDQYTMSIVYQKRRDQINKAREELDIQLLEAEAVFGEIIIKSFSDLFKKQQKLRAAVTSYIESKGSGGKSGSGFKHNILYAMPIREEEEPKNEFSEEIRSIISSIEKDLEPYLFKKGTTNR